MTYVPNADDATQPTDAILAETAQAEFRTLKTKINTMVGLSTSGQSLPGAYVLINNLTVLLASDIAAVNALVAGKAPLVSPAFIGTPTAPTPPVGDNSSNIATTAFVTTAILNASLTPINPAAIKLTIGATLPAVAAVVYVDNQFNTIGSILLPAVPNSQCTYVFIDPTNQWGNFPWNLDGNGNSFSTAIITATAGPVIINFPDSQFTVSWNSTTATWEFC